MALASLALPVVLLAAQPVRAQVGESTAVVVEGPQADQLAGWIEDRVQAPDTLVEGDVFRDALRARGALPLRSAAVSSARDAQLVARVRSAAREHNVDRAVLVDLRKTATATRVHVWAIDLRHPGAVIDSDASLSLSATLIDETRAVLALLPSPSVPVAVEAPETPGPAASSPGETQPVRALAAPDADRVAPSPAPASAGPMLSLQAAMGVGMRHFSYVDRLTPSLRPYDLDAAPLASITATAYPLALLTRVPVIRDLGITGEYAQAFAVSSQDSSGNHVGTTWQSFDVGAIERIPLTRAVMLHVSLGYGGNDFQFDQSLASAGAALPGVAYRFMRAAADLRVELLSALAVFAGGSYLDVLDSGAMGQLFPRETVGGVEAHVGASYAFTPHWQASLGAAYTRFFYSFNPVPGDASVAGGALDEQTRVQAAFAYLL
jgi:hypothetical protein